MEWQPPGGTLGELVAAASTRAESLRGARGELERRVAATAAPPPFSGPLRLPAVAIIAEIKRASPSKGTIAADLPADRQAVVYQQAGAAALSVLTEPTRFMGSNEDLTSVRAHTQLPVLKKDFHVSAEQLLEARALGASAALLIVRALDPSALEVLASEARAIGLELLFEVRNTRELDLALAAGARVIGVNNRDLETLEVDPSTVSRIVPLIPRECIAVAESGMRSPEDVRIAADAGADAVLIGSHFSSAADPHAAVSELTGIPRRARSL